MKPYLILLSLLLLFLSSCSSKSLYLVSKDIHIASENDIQMICLNKAIHDMSSGGSILTDEDKKPLKGISTEYFLWWGSLSGPKPVLNRNKQPSEARSAFPVLDPRKIELAERYVLCLLENGFSWPDEEWIKERFDEIN